MEENRHNNEVESGNAETERAMTPPFRVENERQENCQSNFDPKGSDEDCRDSPILNLEPLRVLWVFEEPEAIPKGIVQEIPSPMRHHWPNPKGFVYGIIDPNDSPKGLSEDETLDELIILALIGDKGCGFNETGFADFTEGSCSVCWGLFDDPDQDDLNTYGIYQMNRQELMDYTQSRRDWDEIEPNLSPMETDLCCRECGVIDLTLKAKALNGGF